MHENVSGWRQNLNGYNADNSLKFFSVAVVADAAATAAVITADTADAATSATTAANDGDTGERKQLSCRLSKANLFFFFFIYCFYGV